MPVNEPGRQTSATIGSTLMPDHAAAASRSGASIPVDDPSRAVRLLGKCASRQAIDPADREAFQAKAGAIAPRHRTELLEP